MGDKISIDYDELLESSTVSPLKGPERPVISTREICNGLRPGETCIIEERAGNFVRFIDPKELGAPALG